MTHDRLGLLLDAIGKAGEFVIMPHNDPDPDAIASAVALHFLSDRRLGISSQIVYKGIVGRAENRALVDYLEHPLNRLPSLDRCPSHPVALVDTQPNKGNNALPANCDVIAVIDHHPSCEQPYPVVFSDIRTDVGATSTILTEYLRAAEIALPRWLATALFYGIKTDTRGLSRGTGRADIDAYFFLQPQVEIEALVRIEQAQVPIQYFRSMASTLQSARIYDGTVLVSYLNKMVYPGLAAEMADLLLRLKGINWVLCMGVYEGEMILSVRTRQRGAERLIQAVVGARGTAGGHGSMSGGQIPLKSEDPDRLARELVRLALSQLGLSPDTEAQPLI